MSRKKKKKAAGQPEKQLELFVRRVRELGDLRLVQEKMGYNFSLSFDQVVGLESTLSGPDEEALRSYLLTFRQFISPSEPVFINKIYNLCFEYLDSNNELRDYLLKSRQVWRSALDTGFMGLTFNEQQLSPKEVADLWINGFYFHNDNDKYERLSELLSSPAMPFVKANFYQLIITATRVIAYLGNFVDQALKQGYFDFKQK